MSCDVAALPFKHWLITGLGLIFSLSRILCDEDGFALKLNDDPPFPHYLHAMPLENITELEVKGSLQLR